jgi:hypothetical protein
MDSYENLVLNPNVLVLAYIQMIMIKRQHGRVTDEFKGNYQLITLSVKLFSATTVNYVDSTNLLHTEYSGLKLIELISYFPKPYQ